MPEIDLARFKQLQCAICAQSKAEKTWALFVCFLLEDRRDHTTRIGRADADGLKAFTRTLTARALVQVTATMEVWDEFESQNAVLMMPVLPAFPAPISTPEVSSIPVPPLPPAKLDFIGRWKTRNGMEAQVTTFNSERGFFAGYIVGLGSYRWDDHGHVIVPVSTAPFDLSGYDLFERLPDSAAGPSIGGKL